MTMRATSDATVPPCQGTCPVALASGAIVMGVLQVRLGRRSCGIRTSLGCGGPLCVQLRSQSPIAHGMCGRPRFQSHLLSARSPQPAQATKKGDSETPRRISRVYTKDRSDGGHDHPFLYRQGSCASARARTTAARTNGNVESSAKPDCPTEGPVVSARKKLRMPTDRYAAWRRS